MPSKILIVDDEPAIRRLLASCLRRSDHEIIEADSARAALASLAIDKPDVVLLDLGLPDRDGLELIGLIRSAGVAVLVISARNETEQKVAALDLGADDYITKPFDTEEVLARIRTALRHRRLPQVQAVQLFGDVEIDLDRRHVRKAGEQVHLTPKEFALLAELAANAGRVVTHRHLLRSIWGAGHDDDVEYLRVAARGLRVKLEDNPSRPELVLNELGVGYRLRG
ncbi:MAG: response regulator [Croceibacterium sp.]